jgi:hypothetical protein
MDAPLMAAHSPVVVEGRERQDAWRDKLALDHIATILRAPERPGAEVLDVIASVVRRTGRSLDHPASCSGCGVGGWYGDGCSAVDDDIDIDAPIRYAVKYEDADGEELCPHDAFTSANDAMACYRALVDDPRPDLGGVYVTRLGDNDEHVIVAHTFA